MVPLRNRESDVVFILSCTDTEILVRGVQAGRPDNSLDNVFFLVLSLFYSLQGGSNGFIEEKTVLS